LFERFHLQNLLAGGGILQFLATNGADLDKSLHFLHSALDSGNLLS